MIRSYISLTKPRICMLVLVTTYLGYYLGLRYSDSYMLHLNEWLIFLYLIIGTLLSCAGACALNQALEYKEDAKMDRTSSRPIPMGIILPLHAFIFGVSLSVIGIIFLYLSIGSLMPFRASRSTKRRP